MPPFRGRSAAISVRTPADTAAASSWTHHTLSKEKWKSRMLSSMTSSGLKNRTVSVRNRLHTAYVMIVPDENRDCFRSAFTSFAPPVLFFRLRPVFVLQV